MDYIEIDRDVWLTVIIGQLFMGDEREHLDRLVLNAMDRFVEAGIACNLYKRSINKPIAHEITNMKNRAYGKIAS